MKKYIYILMVFSIATASNSTAQKAASPNSTSLTSDVKIITSGGASIQGANLSGTSALGLPFVGVPANASLDTKLGLYGAPNKKPVVDTSTVLISPLLLDFGSVDFGKQSSIKAFTITNTLLGDVPVSGTVSAPTSSAFIITSGQGPFTLKHHGDIIPVSVQFNSVHSADYTDTNYDATVPITVNALSKSVHLTAVAHNAGNGVSDFPTTSSQSIYPNPSNGNFSVQLPVKFGHVERVLIIDRKGAEVADISNSIVRKEETSIGCRVRNLASGTYFVKVISGTGSLIYKIDIER